MVDADATHMPSSSTRTVFYPGGGGQPADAGLLSGDSGGDWRVTGAKKRDDDIWHTIHADDELPAVGHEGDRRARLGAAPSAHAHALRPPRPVRGHLARPSASVTGGNMEPLSGRMDFEFETMHGELVGDIERRVNDEIAADREIRVSILPREEAFAIPDLIRTKINLLPEGISEVRTIEIVGLDLQADGGTHVARTSEIGRVNVTGYESKGRINKRIRIEVTD